MSLLVLRMVEERFHRDVEGRPIREGRTPPELLRDGDIEYKACPYSGSRTGKPMNVSALRQISAHWDEFIDALAALRQMYETARGEQRRSLIDIFRISQLGSSLPWYYLLRDEPCPAYAAALSKATLGMGIWAQREIIRSIARGGSEGAWTSQRMLEVAEGNDTLVGETEVCSAGDKMLLKFFDAIVTDQPGKLPLAPEAILRFGAHYLGFKQIIWLYFLARRFLYHDVGATEMLQAPCEPFDFFIIEPSNAATMPLHERTAWFRKLAMMEPLAPDGSDRALVEAAEAIATVMGETLGESPKAHAIATFAKLDNIYGSVIAIVEGGFRGTPFEGVIDHTTRDRLVLTEARSFFAAL